MLKDCINKGDKAGRRPERRGNLQVDFSGIDSVAFGFLLVTKREVLISIIVEQSLLSDIQRICKYYQQGL